MAANMAAEPGVEPHAMEQMLINTCALIWSRWPRSGLSFGDSAAFDGADDICRQRGRDDQDGLVLGLAGKHAVEVALRKLDQVLQWGFDLVVRDRAGSGGDF
ncbi:MAG: hypothetical protein Q4G26_04565 [Paracoccus sp. (in: a-proteobacteria)]|nr:hypothetical protein [Paracoccus sp. (in: a-proteobacteria)]